MKLILQYNPFYIYHFIRITFINEVLNAGMDRFLQSKIKCDYKAVCIRYTQEI